MFAYINHRLHLLNTARKPEILIYGCTTERVVEIKDALGQIGYSFISVSTESKIAMEIKRLKPKLLIIGGRCSPNTRLLIRYLATKEKPNIQFSEPGLAYRNDPENIAKDVLKKLRNVSVCPLNNDSLLMNNRVN